MSKIIRVSGMNAGPTAPRIVRTPGVGGYAARFIASHVDTPVGSVVGGLDSAGGTVPMSLTPLAGKASTLTMAVENGIKHIQSPGDGMNGGRLLGPHTAQRPITLAAVVKVAAGVSSFLGITGSYFSRNTTGAGNYTANANGVSAFPMVERSGWVFLMLTQAAGGAFVVRADSSEAQGTTAGAPPASNGGLYFGSPTVGQAASMREIIYWPRDLAQGERDAVHNYMRSRYPELV